MAEKKYTGTNWKDYFKEFHDQMDHSIPKPKKRHFGTKYNDSWRGTINKLRAAYVSANEAKQFLIRDAAIASASNNIVESRAYRQRACMAHHRVEALRFEAATNIFHEMNPNMRTFFDATDNLLGNFKGSVSNNFMSHICLPEFIDLHGLYVDEAVHYLDMFLEKCLCTLKSPRFNHTRHIIHIITGIGRHSINNRAKLPRSVMTYLSTKKTKWRLGAEGVIVVLLLAY